VQETGECFKSSILQGKDVQQVYAYLGCFTCFRDLDVIYSRYRYIVGAD
jgi:hypothetical protein